MPLQFYNAFSYFRVNDKVIYKSVCTLRMHMHTQISVFWNSKMLKHVLGVQSKYGLDDISIAVTFILI